MKKTMDTVGKRLAVVLLVFSMFGAALVLDTEPAEAQTTYNVYESRSTVVKKAGWINLPGHLCGIGGMLTGKLHPLVGAGFAATCYLTSGTGSAGIAYDYAALRDCRMRVNVTVTNSIYSWNKSVIKYYPYACRR